MSSALNLFLDLTELESNGAAIMLGSKNGVTKLMKEKFPSLIVWCSANYISELSIGDTVKSVTGIDRFKAFTDKLYVVYEVSPKNTTELNLCRNLLDIGLKKLAKF
jgi:hypothetical protein